MSKSNLSFFLNPHLGYFTSSVDPDQSAFSEVADHDLHCHAICAVLHNLVDMTCFHLLNITSDDNFYFNFGQTT